MFKAENIAFPKVVLPFSAHSALSFQPHKVFSFSLPSAFCQHPIPVSLHSLFTQGPGAALPVLLISLTPLPRLYDPSQACGFWTWKEPPAPTFCFLYEENDLRNEVNGPGFRMIAWIWRYCCLSPEPSTIAQPVSLHFHFHPSCTRIPGYSFWSTAVRLFLSSETFRGLPLPTKENPNLSITPKSCT